MSDSIGRRQFLQGLLAAAVLIRVGDLGGSKFSGEAGKSIRISKGDADIAKELLMDDASKMLPRGTLYEIRLGIPEEFGRLQSMAWYTDEDIRRHRPFPTDGYEFIPAKGIYLAGRYRVGEVA